MTQTQGSGERIQGSAAEMPDGANERGQGPRPAVVGRRNASESERGERRKTLASTWNYACQLTRPESATTQSGRCTTLTFPLLLALALGTTAMAEPGFLETFADDPIAAGRFALHPDDTLPPGAPSPFEYQPETHSLLAHLDTAKPTARLVAPLCRTLTERDSFTFTARIRIRSQGLTQYPCGFAPLSVGLMNSQTGPDRVGYSGLAASYDVVSIDYFPQLNYDPWSPDFCYTTPPTLSSTIMTSEPPDAQYGVLTGLWRATIFPWNSESELLEPEEAPAEPDLPRDTFLTFVLKYQAPTTFSGEQGPYAVGRASLTVYQETQALPINEVGDVLPEYDDGDASTITTVLYLDNPALTQRPEFKVNQIGIFLWQDSYTVYMMDPNISSITADYDIQHLELTWTASADFTGDWMVNEADVTYFQNCKTGPAIPPTDSECAKADLDCDDDVDQDDFGLLQRQIGAPGPQ